LAVDLQVGRENAKDFAGVEASSDTVASDEGAPTKREGLRQGRISGCPLVAEKESEGM